MRKNKALALALAAAMTASMTPITAMADETEGLTSYYTYQTAVNEMETFCVQNAQNAKELQVLIPELFRLQVHNLHHTVPVPAPV